MNNKFKQLSLQCLHKYQTHNKLFYWLGFGKNTKFKQQTLLLLMSRHNIKVYE